MNCYASESCPVTSISGTHFKIVRQSAGSVKARILPVIDEEIREGELMRVEQERRNAEGQNRYPEVYDPRDPQGHGYV